MSYFLKLPNRVINTRAIQQIEVYKNTFVIHLMTNKTDGFWMFAAGIVDSHNTEIEVCKIKDEEAYRAINDWITKTINKSF